MTSRLFFLGAGFSKALNPAYPTLHELSHAVVGNFVARYPSGAIRQHFDQLPNGFEKDIEQLLTYLYSDWPWKSSVDGDLDKALYKAFVYEIAGALNEIPMSPISEELRMFIHYMRSLESNKIVSLNYDGLVEQYRFPQNFSSGTVMLKGLEFEIEEKFWKSRRTSTANPWVVDRPNPKSRSGTPKNLMTVAREWISSVSFEEFKSAVEAASSHPDDALQSGQFSWLRTAHESFRKYDEFYPIEKFGAKLLHMDESLVAGSTGKVMHLHGALAWVGDDTGPTIRLPDGSLKRLPAIVPPVMDKSQHYAAGNLRKQWINAHSGIQKSEEIVIIGFSFPPTDISCQFLFKSAVAPGTRVVVVNRDASLRDRYNTIFSGLQDVRVDYSYIGHDDSLLRYIHSEVLNT